MEEGLNAHSIKDLENFAGIKAHTIRIWEKRHAILSPDRTDSNIRTYSESELKKILNVVYLNNRGYKISKIAKLNEEELAKKVIEISKRSYSKIEDSSYDRILSPVSDFDEGKLRAGIASLIAKYDFETAYRKHIYLLMERARIMWQTESFSRSQMQFVGSVVKNIIIAESALLKPKTQDNAPCVAMVNVSNNMADNNFLFYKYVLTKRGFNVIYPGGILPAAEAFEIYMIKPFEYAVINSSSFDFAGNKLAYFQNIGRSLMLKKIIFTDFFDTETTQSEEVLQYCATPSDFIKAVDAIQC